MRDQQNGPALPEQVEGKLVTRVSLGLDVLARLQGQVQQTFMNIRPASTNGAKTERSLVTPASGAVHAAGREPRS
jgi:hypothetical protein